MRTRSSYRGVETVSDDVISEEPTPDSVEAAAQDKLSSSGVQEASIRIHDSSKDIDMSEEGAGRMDEGKTKSVNVNPEESTADSLKETTHNQSSSGVQEASIRIHDSSKDGDMSEEGAATGRMDDVKVKSVNVNPEESTADSLVETTQNQPSSGVQEASISIHSSSKDIDMSEEGAGRMDDGEPKSVNVNPEESTADSLEETQNQPSSGGQEASIRIQSSSKDIDMSEEGAATGGMDDVKVKSVNVNPEESTADSLVETTQNQPSSGVQEASIRIHDSSKDGDMSEEGAATGRMDDVKVKSVNVNPEESTADSLVETTQNQPSSGVQEASISIHSSSKDIDMSEEGAGRMDDGEPKSVNVNPEESTADSLEETQNQPSSGGQEASIRIQSSSKDIDMSEEGAATGGMDDVKVKSVNVNPEESTADSLVETTQNQPSSGVQEASISIHSSSKDIDMSEEGAGRMDDGEPKSVNVNPEESTADSLEETQNQPSSGGQEASIRIQSSSKDIDMSEEGAATGGMDDVKVKSVNVNPEESTADSLVETTLNQPSSGVQEASIRIHDSSKDGDMSEEGAATGRMDDVKVKSVNVNPEESTADSLVETTQNQPSSGVQEASISIHSSSKDIDMSEEGAGRMDDGEPKSVNVNPEESTADSLEETQNQPSSGGQEASIRIQSSSKDIDMSEEGAATGGMDDVKVKSVNVNPEESTADSLVETTQNQPSSGVQEASISIHSSSKDIDMSEEGAGRMDDGEPKSVNVNPEESTADSLEETQNQPSSGGQEASIRIQSSSKDIDMSEEGAATGGMDDVKVKSVNVNPEESTADSLVETTQNQPSSGVQEASISIHSSSKDIDMSEEGAGRMDDGEPKSVNVNPEESTADSLEETQNQPSSGGQEASIRIQSSSKDIDMSDEGAATGRMDNGETKIVEIIPEESIRDSLEDSTLVQLGLETPEASISVVRSSTVVKWTSDAAETESIPESIAGGKTETADRVPEKSVEGSTKNDLDPNSIVDADTLKKVNGPSLCVSPGPGWRQRFTIVQAFKKVHAKYKEFMKIAVKYCKAKKLTLPPERRILRILYELALKKKLNEHELKTCLDRCGEFTGEQDQTFPEPREILPPVVKKIRFMKEDEQKSALEELKRLKAEMKPIAIQHCHKIKAPFNQNVFHMVCLTLLEVGMVEEEFVKLGIELAFEESCKRPLLNDEINFILKRYCKDHGIVGQKNPQKRVQILSTIPENLLTLKHYWSLMYKLKKINLFSEKHLYVGAAKKSVPNSSKPPLVISKSQTNFGRAAESKSTSSGKKKRLISCDSNVTDNVRAIDSLWSNTKPSQFVDNSRRMYYRDTSNGPNSNLEFVGSSYPDVSGEGTSKRDWYQLYKLNSQKTTSIQWDDIGQSNDNPIGELLESKQPPPPPRISSVKGLVEKKRGLQNDDWRLSRRLGPPVKKEKFAKDRQSQPGRSVEAYTRQWPQTAAAWSSEAYTENLGRFEVPRGDYSLKSDVGEHSRNSDFVGHSYPDVPWEGPSRRDWHQHDKLNFQKTNSINWDDIGQRNDDPISELPELKHPPPPKISLVKGLVNKERRLQNTDDPRSSGLQRDDWRSSRRLGPPVKKAKFAEESLSRPGRSADYQRTGDDLQSHFTRRENLSSSRPDESRANDFQYQIAKDTQPRHSHSGDLQHAMNDFDQWMSRSNKSSGTSNRAPRGRTSPPPVAEQQTFVMKENPPFVPHGSTCKVAIVPFDYPKNKITEQEADLIRNTLLERIGAQRGTGPRFVDTYEERGAVVFECADQLTVSWVWENASTIQSRRTASYRPTSWEKPPKEISIQIPIMLQNLTPQALCERLMSQNPGLSTESWKLKLTDFTSRKFVFYIDDDSMEILKSLDLRPYLGFSRVNVDVIQD